MIGIRSMCLAFWGLAFASLGVTASGPAEPPVYVVKRAKKPVPVNGNWNKPEWKKVKAVGITHFIRSIPSFHPEAEVKMTYDAENIYVVFRVHDRYVRCLTTSINGPVWKDAAVELFFSPDTALPEQYFNLEINCGGTALLGYRSGKPTTADIERIEIAHSLPQQIDPEMAGPVIWTLEYKVPLDMLEHYSHVVRPAKGVRWKANFCKIAENNTNPHYMTWSPIEAPQPNFHMPQFFGTLQFE